MTFGLALAAAPAAAWYVEGHRRVAEDAVGRLPQSVPAFFRRGAAAIGHGAVDPDVMKAPGTPRLRDREEPEHFFDWEVLGGQPVPELRSEYARLMHGLRRDAARTGTLPYAVIEGTERLILAFAEVRRWPENPHLQTNALLYAGWLAHYAADLCQPLHTTIHHDGRTPAGGSSPHTGIHSQVDALFEVVPFDRDRALDGLEIRAAADVRRATLAELADSHRRVDEVYRQEGSLASPPPGSPWPSGVVAFAGERYQASVRFVATLFLTAWEQSESIELPGWLERTQR